MTFQVQKQPPRNSQSFKKENLIGWNGGRLKTWEIWEASDELKKFATLMFTTMSLSHQEKFKWCKAAHQRNTMLDKSGLAQFHNSYPTIPHSIGMSLPLARTNAGEAGTQYLRGSSWKLSINYSPWSKFTWRTSEWHVPWPPRFMTYTIPWSSWFSIRQN